MAGRKAGGVGGPFLKWAGGKGALLAAYEPLFPRKFAAYHEPFLGAGAVFFRLAATGRASPAWLSDRNRPLIDSYLAVRDRLEDLCLVLARLRAAHDPAHYYAARDRFNRGEGDPLERAALFIYFNKTAYNGLWRVNRSGGFNVPIGRYADPQVLDRPVLEQARRLLAGASIEVRDFAIVLERAEPGDFVYLDPPYDPLSSTASFTAYGQGGFPRAEQERLAEMFRRLAGRGVKVMLSNHDTPLVRQLYRGFDLTGLTVTRAINSRAARRGDAVGELVVRSYGA